jgi:acetyltransferase
MAEGKMLAERHALDAFFSPRNIAIIGATERERTVGRATFENLLATPFGGQVFPVNARNESVLGVKAFKSILDIPDPVDLAVIVTPSRVIPDLIRECGQKGVTAAIVISAGFKEMGPEGVELEERLLAEARAAGIRIIGPNCLGVMAPLSGVNATFAHAMAKPGGIGFISQSGAMCTAVLDWSFNELVGFSAFVSVGSMLDVGWGDLIDYLGQDHHTRAILIYMEAIGDARSFMSAAREVALVKPIIVIKAGRTAEGGQAAASHTGSLAGSDEVLDAAFRRCGVLRVNSIGDLFYMAEVLGKQPRPAGDRLTILTNAGGPAVLATDALITAGGHLAELSEETKAALNEVLPATWSHGNPIDIIGDATPERYEKSLAIAAKDPNSDGLLVILTPQAMTHPTDIAESLKKYSKLGKPVLASWMGGPLVQAGERILNAAGIPTFAYPDTAARMFQYMWEYNRALRQIYETPTFTDHAPPDTARVTRLIEAARAEGRTILTEYESKDILEAYGIPVTPSKIATTVDEAVAASDAIGYPVVLKLHSTVITHKTDVGGVILNIKDADGVRAAFEGIKSRVPPEALQGVNVQKMEKLEGYELIIGSSLDAQFGPVILFGMGGTLVEVFKDSALGLPPLNSTLARRMIERTTIYQALKGVRGRAPVDEAALAGLLVRFSQLVIDHRWIAEIDINPLLASPERLLALDGRVVLLPPETKKEDIPRLAIRPYPNRYVGSWDAKDGSRILFRPIRPEDEPLMVKFHESVSDASIYLRYFQFMKLSQRIAHERLSRIVFNDYDRELALVAVQDGAILGVGRLRKTGDGEGELGMLIADAAQNKGLGSEMMQRLIDVAKREGLTRIVADVHSDNAKMLHVVRKFGFQVKSDPRDPIVQGTLNLAG